MSRYIWRGFDFGNSPAIQPNLYLSWKGLNFGFWGSYSFAPYRRQVNDSVSVDMGNSTEMDMYISYTLKWFTLMAYDYFRLLTDWILFDQVSTWMGKHGFQTIADLGEA